MNKFNVTYEIVTPKSAEQGDVAARGFIVEDVSLREALRECDPTQDSGSWFDEVDGRTNYRTGAVETRSLHPPRSITKASYRRLARLLGAR